MGKDVPRHRIVRLAQAGALVMAALAVLAAIDDRFLTETAIVATRLIVVALLLLIAFTLAVSERREAAAERHASESDERTRRILDNTNEAYVAMDTEGRVTAWNSAAETMFGYRREHAIGREVAELIIPPDMRDAHRAGLDRFLFTGEGPVVGPRTELVAVREDGSEVPVELSITAIQEAGGWSFHGFVRDVTARKALDDQHAALLARAEESARIDALTALPNRRHWDEELGREIARARRTGEDLCVALLDLDHFKAFNDTHGHREGDRLLRNCAAAWRMAIRGSDFLARYGGEEFAVLLPDCDLDGALEVIERLRAQTPEVQTVSAGIAQWDETETTETLIDRADLALYEAKSRGRDRAAAAA
jgi:diguanylate cyclase (GGDEF)-like protein/PAS domain S-box-containing protein